MKKYRVLKCVSVIDVLECIKETEHTITIMGKYFGKPREIRESKNTNYQKIFDTFQEAKDYNISQCVTRIESYERNIEREQKNLEEIQMQEETK